MYNGEVDNKKLSMIHLKEDKNFRPAEKYKSINSRYT